MRRASKSGATRPSQVYQFKITLLDVEPPVWRRIQIQDCTLDALHEHIQTAMGWTNSHLHQFRIGGRCYGDPKLLDDGGGDDDFIDSTALRVSRLLENERISFCFHYEYNFGDGWRHELVYEGMRPVETGVEYPRCIEGAYACPPEDVGGPWAYADFLATIRDPKREDHEERRQWVGGRFDPEVFDPQEASREMRRGLPDWRDDL